MSTAVATLVFLPFTIAVQVPAANDWVRTGTDCALFAAGDVDGDAFADVLTLNGSGQLCVAYSVRGWKSAAWEVLVEGLPGGAEAVCIQRAEAAVFLGVEYPGEARWYHQESATNWREVQRPIPCSSPSRASQLDPEQAPTHPTQGESSVPGSLLSSGLEIPSAQLVLAVTAPPYEPEARLLLNLSADFSGDGGPDAAAVFDCLRPEPHRVLRVAIAPNAAHTDQDADGLTDERERLLGTNPYDRDSDDDGLLDSFEVDGLPRAAAGGANLSLSPLRQDVICIIAPYAGVDVAAAQVELQRAAALYRALPNTNPDGSSGIALHFRIDPAVASERQFGGSWYECGNAHMRPEERGLMHWMQLTPYGGGQAQQTGDMGGCGTGYAVFAHEFGHQLSLSHSGDSTPAWCPLYPSLMSYAFSYSLGGDSNAIRFSDGRFRSVALSEAALQEQLPFAYQELRYLEAAPFRFLLADDGSGGTRIDWNHNGVFDEQVVSADINYGGSTHGGIRRNLGLSGSGLALAVVAGKSYLVHARQNQAALVIREYLGDERWSEGREVPNGVSCDDPIAIGGAGDGFLLLKKRVGWRVQRFDAQTIEPAQEIPGLYEGELSALRVGERILLLRRVSDGGLAAAWLTYGQGTVGLSAWQELELRSLVAPGLALEPQGQRIVCVGSWTNSNGGRYQMRVTWLRIKGDTLVQEETIWTHGEGATNQCTTRPVVSFKDGQQLCIFHTAWPGEEGLMSMWRTLRVGNLALDQGWLTTMLYDIWTLTRVPIAFCDGPEGAIFAFRWDAGDVHGMHINDILVGHNGYGIDPEPMRDFDDGAQIALWGIRHSILTMSRTP